MDLLVQTGKVNSEVKSGNMVVVAKQELFQSCNKLYFYVNKH